MVATRPPLHWVADRPPSAKPVAKPSRTVEPTPTPSYRFIPRWGLTDLPPDRHASSAETPDVRGTLPSALMLAAYPLAAAAVVHLVRYLIVVVNRSTPIPQLLDLLSSAAVLVFGVCAVIGMVFALVSFTRWMLATRAAAYAAAGTGDPRGRRHQILLTALPLVNVVGAPLLLAEAAQCGDDVAGAGARIKKISIAWAIVNALAVLAVAYRIGGWFSDSVQVHADGLAVLTASLAVSAMFAYWVVPRLPIVLTGPIGEDGAERRLVAA